MSPRHSFSGMVLPLLVLIKGDRNRRQANAVEVISAGTIQKLPRVDSRMRMKRHFVSRLSAGGWSDLQSPSRIVRP